MLLHTIDHRVGSVRAASQLVSPSFQNRSLVLEPAQHGGIVDRQAHGTLHQFCDSFSKLASHIQYALASHSQLLFVHDSSWRVLFET